MNFRESPRQRARKDAGIWLRNHVVAWLLAFILPGVGTCLAAWLIPPGADLTVSILLGLLGGLVGLLLLFGGALV
jgi:hypothetical protein